MVDFDELIPYDSKQWVKGSDWHDKSDKCCECTRSPKYAQNKGTYKQLHIIQDHAGITEKVKTSLKRGNTQLQLSALLHCSAQAGEDYCAVSCAALHGLHSA